MYQVEFTATAQKDILSFRYEIQERLELAIESLEIQPRPSGCKKLKDRDNTWRIRVSDYRILYGINDRLKVVIIYRIRHRKEVYK
jgi:mRNA interferase RelE/StbE